VTERGQHLAIKIAHVPLVVGGDDSAWVHDDSTPLCDSPRKIAE
jgi:hypothetical protein